MLGTSLHETFGRIHDPRSALGQQARRQVRSNHAGSLQMILSLPHWGGNRVESRCDAVV